MVMTMRSTPLMLLLAALVARAEDSPRDIMDKSDRLHRVAFEHTRSKMVLQEKDGPPRERTLESWTVADDKGGDKTRVKFHSPADVQGTGLLSLENTQGGEDEQWLYLPAFKKTRRVGQSELGDRFVGTDIFYEDMKRRHVDDYAYKALPSEVVDGQDCWLIEATPSAPKVVKESPYGKSLTWVRKDNFFVVRARLFDKKLEPLKQLDATRLKQIAKTAWRADLVTIVDVKRKHRTVVTILEREVKPTADDVFTKRHLEAE